MEGPFHPDEPATGSRFIGRKRIVTRLKTALADPDQPILLTGPPRSGVTSVVHEARRRLGDEAPRLVEVDVATGSTATDLANRVLAAASEIWTGEFRAWVEARVGPASRTSAGLRVEDRSRALRDEAQRELFGTVMESVSDYARSQGSPGTALVLDGVDRLTAIAGDEALWHLRSVLSRCDGVSVILTSSSEVWTETETRDGAALQGWGSGGVLRPIKTKRWVPWLRTGMKELGLKLKTKAARRILDASGPRAGDVVRMAATVAEVARLDRGRIRRSTPARARTRILSQRGAIYALTWTRLTGRQQNLLRALSAGETKPFAEHVRTRFDLRSTAAVARTLELLGQRGLVSRGDEGYGMDDPFFREWIVRTALPDIGPPDRSR